MPAPPRLRAVSPLRLYFSQPVPTSWEVAKVSVLARQQEGDSLNLDLLGGKVPYKKAPKKETQELDEVGCHRRAVSRPFPDHTLLIIPQTDIEFKKKQAEEAKKIKELAEKAKKGPLGSVPRAFFLFACSPS